MDDENAKDYHLIQYQSWNTQEGVISIACCPVSFWNVYRGVMELPKQRKRVDHHHGHDTRNELARAMIMTTTSKMISNA
jgi:hypothetical protein